MAYDRSHQASMVYCFYIYYYVYLPDHELPISLRLFLRTPSIMAPHRPVYESTNTMLIAVHSADHTIHNTMLHAHNYLHARTYIAHLINTNVPVILTRIYSVMCIRYMGQSIIM